MINDRLRRARERHAGALRALEELDVEIDSLPAGTTSGERRHHLRRLNLLSSEVGLAREEHERAVAVATARERIPRPQEDTPMANHPVARGSLREEWVYRPDTDSSFFRDVVMSRNDPAAMERLTLHQAQALETRDVTTADPGGAGFVPPIYLGSAYADLPREGRPFADLVPKMSLPDVGMTVTIPKVQSGTTTAVQAAEADAVSETDIDTQTVTAGLVTIAGMNDVSLQVLERTFPGLDQVIYRDLLADYDEQLDTQLISGSASSGQHRGLSAVSGINTVTWTDSTPTSAEALPKIYDAIQKIASDRHRNADTILIHPRRAAWLASNLSSTFPLFQQGTLTQAVGTQNGGFPTSFGGLRVVLDANISTTIATDQDEMYVLHTPDLLLMEGPAMFVRFDDVLSGTLQVRLRLHGFSFFVPHRQPKAITQIRGAGLAAPTF
jgi:HK97 family phage major capsid protein